jgi:transposase
MGRCYSLDLRERIVDFVVQGASRRAAARRFGVSESFAVKLMQHRERHGSPAPGRQGRPRGSGKLDRLESYLIGEVEAQPDITMPELAGRLMAVHGVEATPAMLSRFLCRHGFTYKKSPFGGGVRTR